MEAGPCANMGAVLCRTCGKEHSGDQCPECGAQDAEIDWRREVKRKLAQHIEKKQDPAAHSDRKVTRPAPRRQRAKRKNSDAVALFDYKPPEEESEPEPRVVSLAARTSPSQRVAEKPVVRRQVSAGKSARPQAHSPQQKSLSLEASPHLSSAAAPQESPSIEATVSREIIFSRILAGIVDLCFPLLISLVFTFSASSVLNFDFISALSMRLGLIFWMSFFVLNSFFFLLLSGQTPGMLLTDLRLVGEDHEEVSFQSLALRILLFIPITASLVGLIWGIFDPLCRCGHDLLSRTRIVPSSSK